MAKERQMRNKPMEGLERMLEGVKGFAAEMREKGIHVGMGQPGVCVTCDQAWPCDGAKG